MLMVFPSMITLCLAIYFEVVASATGMFLTLVSSPKLGIQGDFVTLVSSPKLGIQGDFATLVSSPKLEGYRMVFSSARIARTSYISARSFANARMLGF